MVTAMLPTHRKQRRAYIARVSAHACNYLFHAEPALATDWRQSIEPRFYTLF
jgi:hypothetical protein